MNKTTRTCAGEYERTDGVNTVRVFYHELCKGWMAAANWTRDTYTDPLPTKRDAIYNADCMLADERKERAA